MLIATKFRFGSRLCKGNVLAPLTSVVLNENRFDCSLLGWVLYLKITCKRIRKKKIINKVLDEDWVPHAYVSL